MTEATDGRRATGSRAGTKRNTAAWKSGILAASAGAVVLGAALFVRTGSGTEATVAEAQPVIALDASSRGDDDFLLHEDDQEHVFDRDRRFSRGAMGQQPGFARPLTRSRGS